MATKNGLTLAAKIAPAMDSEFFYVAEVCSAICRNAATHNRLCEIECSVAMTEQQQENHAKKMARVESRIVDLIDSLPTVRHPLLSQDGRRLAVGAFGAFFQHDPRGYTVGLTAPEEWQHLYDGWGRDRINVRVDA